MRATTRSRRGTGGALALTAAALLLTAAGARTAQAQQPAAATAAAAVAPAPAALPASVLLFPATIPTDAGEGGGAAATAARPTTSVAETVVTDSVRRFLNRGGIGVVVYNRRLPAIERAVAEGLRPEDALRGPGDDPRKAKNFADILGAAEYLTVLIDDYKFDPATRTATFNLSVTRNAADGTSLGASAQKAVGSAPADVPASRREAFAVASAADVVAQQTVEGLFPGSAARINPPKEAPKKKRRGAGNLLIPAVAVGAAIIGTNI